MDLCRHVARAAAWELPEAAQTARGGVADAKARPRFWRSGRLDDDGDYGGGRTVGGGLATMVTGAKLGASR